uniref:Uncharacterized protein n=1 Tax=Sphaerodactylus townsendi TaxID=933632 RepID=A0ACB8EQ07_9SAUR
MRVQVEAYMRMMEDYYKNDTERVHEIGDLLEAKAAAWLVGLLEEDAPKLRNFDWFMLALQWRFEDPFLEEKARAHLQRLQQGNCSVADYRAEFQQLASRLWHWPERIFIHMFKDVLDPEVSNGP